MAEKSEIRFLHRVGHHTAKDFNIRLMILQARLLKVKMLLVPYLVTDGIAEHLHGEIIGLFTVKGLD